MAISSAVFCFCTAGAGGNGGAFDVVVEGAGGGGGDDVGVAFLGTFAVVFSETFALGDGALLLSVPSTISFPSSSYTGAPLSFQYSRPTALISLGLSISIQPPFTNTGLISMPSSIKICRKSVI